MGQAKTPAFPVVASGPPAGLMDEDARVLDGPIASWPQGDDDLHIRHRTLPEQVADRIVHGIARGIFPTGERLHEPLLVARLKVSRAPIREALRILDAQGILIAEPQKGHRIVRFDRPRIEACYEIRRALEQVSITRAAERIRQDGGCAIRLRAILADMVGHLEQKDSFAMNRADLAFHTELVRLSGNEMLINIWRGLTRHVLIIFALETRGDRRALDREYAEHVSLFDAILTASPAALTDEIARHLQVPALPNGAPA